MFTLKLTQLGNSVGVVLPKELLARLHVENGDTVFATESPDGVRLTPFAPNFEQQMKAAREMAQRSAGTGQMNVWQWIEEAVVLAIHDEQLAEHCGSTGIERWPI
ncbi:hypothetical protein CCP3SC1_2420002 [Gammaproteobacteria bacterium]